MPLRPGELRKCRNASGVQARNQNQQEPAHGKRHGIGCPAIHGVDRKTGIKSMIRSV
jgi:hypothetical protein